MKINVYKNREIVKTFTADTYDLLFGTLEDVANAVQLDSMKTGSDDEVLKATFNLVAKSKDTVKDLLKDIFPGITDEEIRGTTVTEIAQLLFDIVKYTIEQLGKGFKTKN